jgi:hypothetical protein
LEELELDELELDELELDELELDELELELEPALDDEVDELELVSDFLVEPVLEPESLRESVR